MKSTQLLRCIANILHAHSRLRANGTRSSRIKQINSCIARMAGAIRRRAGVNVADLSFRLRVHRRR